MAGVGGDGHPPRGLFLQEGPRGGDERRQDEERLPQGHMGSKVDEQTKLPTIFERSNKLRRRFGVARERRVPI
eukprot:1185382-Prorocentrum_minimum.AAC.1